MTTSVLAAGITQEWAFRPAQLAGLLARGSWPRSGQTGNRSPQIVPADLPRLPGCISWKGGRFVDVRGVLPRLIMMHCQWLFRRHFRTARLHPCRLSATRNQRRTENPDRSTVAGSALMTVPELGPPLHIPFSSAPIQPVRNHPLWRHR